jgi:undecaprenyl-diphosphatase
MTVKQFDIQAARLISLLPNQFGTPFRWLAYPTMPLAWCVVFVLFVLVGPVGQRSAAFVILILLPSATIVKHAFRRQRPPTIYAGGMKIKSYSFPSSHAYCSALGGVFLGIMAVRSEDIVLAIALFVLPIIVGISRIYVGAHYPSDVIAGWMSGILLAVGVLAIW